MVKKKVRFIQSVSVPPELKARMDEVQEPVNWSAVACQAFEAKLNEIVRRKDSREMSEVIERLRASMKEATSAEYDKGFELGQQWAMTTAKYDELRRLEEFEPCTEAIDWEPSEQLFFAIQPPDYDRDRRDSESFWEMAIGDDVELTDGVVEGFSDGAVDLWRKVKNQL